MRGDIVRNNEMSGCLEQLYLYLTYQGHDYKSPPEPTLLRQDCRFGYKIIKPFEIRLPNEPNPYANKVFV